MEIARTEGIEQENKESISRSTVPNGASDLETHLDSVRSISREKTCEQLLNEAEILHHQWPTDLAGAGNAGLEDAVDAYLMQIAAAERKFGCLEEKEDVGMSSQEEEAFDDEDGLAAALNVVALSLDLPQDNEGEQWRILAHTSWDLATRAIAFKRDTVVILVCVDDTSEDFEDSPAFRASVLYLLEFVKKDLKVTSRLVVTGHGRGGRLAATVASRLTEFGSIRVIAFQSCPHHIIGPDMTLYTGAPRLDLCSSHARGLVSCQHYRLADVDRPRRWPIRCFLGSATRLATIATVAAPLTKVYLLTAEIARIVSRSATTALFATEAIKVALSRKNFFGDEAPCTREARLLDATRFSDILYSPRSVPKRIRILRWPSLYDQLRDLVFDMLRSELLLFHPANAGLHTLVNSEAAYSAWLQRRSGYQESSKIQERHPRPISLS